jgi:hypothetical protein
VLAVYELQYGVLRRQKRATLLQIQIAVPQLPKKPPRLPQSFMIRWPAAALCIFRPRRPMGPETVNTHLGVNGRSVCARLAPGSFTVAWTSQGGAVPAWDHGRKDPNSCFQKNCVKLSANGGFTPSPLHGPYLSSYLYLPFSSIEAPLANVFTW